MTRSRRGLYPCACVCVMMGWACTRLEPTRVVAPDGDAGMRDAQAEAGSPRDDAGREVPEDGGDAARPPIRDAGGDGGDGSVSGDAGDAGDEDAGAPPPAGRCTGDGEMVDIAAGDFLRGDPGIAAATPAQLVAVDGFAIDRTEVTVVAYADCVDAGECTEPTAIGYCNWGVAGRDCHPINCVSWQQADAYCQWANKRLPTETEWEFAARGPMSRSWPWGEDEDGLPDDPGYVQWKGSAGTAVVGTHLAGATPEGLLDMAGNVWEWTSSTWCDSWAPTATCDSSLHVDRGGSWMSADYTFVRPAFREADPAGGDDRFGFRCAD